VSGVDNAQPPDRLSASRRRRAAPAAALALGVLVLVLTGTTLALSTLVHKGTWLDVATGLPFPLAYAGVGVIVARHQPRNPIGWILILFVVLFLISVDVGYYAVLRYRLGDHGLPLGPAAVVLASSWPLALALFPLVILLFPDGRLPSPAWRWAMWAYLAAGPAFRPSVTSSR
jgi:two-component system, NarL family, sensor kinase